MRFSSMIALIGASLVAASDVLDLTSDTFESVVNKESLILVEFFAPWCGHCKALAPEYEIAATQLKEKNLKIAKVDCVEQADLCSTMGVTGYPTLKVFRDGEPSDYGGARKADGIVSYMVKQSLPAVSQVAAAEHDEFLKSDKVVVVAYLATTTDAPASAYSKVASQHRDDYLFGMVTDSELAAKAGVTPPAVVLYKQFDEGRVEFPTQGIKDTSVDGLSKFITENAMPLLDEISGDNYPAYSASGLPLAYLFLDPAAEGNEVYLEAIKPVAKKNKGVMNFVWIDGVKYTDHAKTLGVKPEAFPTFVIQNIVDGSKYPITASTPSFAVADAHVAAYLAGKLEPTLKSQEIPEQTEPVTVIVGKTFDQYINDETKDVLVEFYAPWCGHCKRLKPTWDELGEHFASVKDKVTIAKMDATENDLPPTANFKIAGFPTIKFRAAGQKEFIDYEGDRTLESFTSFVMEHASNTFTLPPKAEATSSQVTPAETHAAHEGHSHEEL